MTDTKVETKGEVKEERLPRQFGLRPDKVLLKLQNCLVTLALIDGQALTGQLVGYDEYNYVVRTSTGVVLVHKGQVATLRPAAKAANGSPGASG